MSIRNITEEELRLTNTLRLITEVLKQITAERDALRIEVFRLNQQRLSARTARSEKRVALAIDMHPADSHNQSNELASSSKIEA